MYWCKRLIEWTPNARTAMEWAIYLNNKYQLDGRDENGYMGIAWCFGRHDRPFPERPVFGTVRSMSPAGLESKFDMPKYARIVRAACQQEKRPEVRALLPRQALTGTRSILAFFGGGGAARKAPVATGGEGGSASDKDGVDAQPSSKRLRS